MQPYTTFFQHLIQSDELSKETSRKILREIGAITYSKGLWDNELVKEVQNIILTEYLISKMYNRHTLPANPKTWENLSSSSRRVYARTLKQITKEMPAKCFPLDLICLLVKSAKERSRSRYYSMRTCLLKISKSSKQLDSLLSLLPPYRRLCEYCGVVPTGRIDEITQDRRKSKDMKMLLRILLELKPQYRSEVLGMIYSGCRKSELATLKISIGKYQQKEVYIISIKNAKTGCRKDPKETHRHLFIDPESTAGVFWRTLAGIYSPEPFGNMKTGALDSAWRRARQKYGLSGDQSWCLHAFRHDFSSELKNRLRSSDKNIKLMNALGHNGFRQSSIYGNRKNPSRINPGVIHATEI